MVSQRSFHCIFILSGINSCLNQTNEHNKGKRIQKTKRCKSSLLRSIKCTVIITHIPTLHGFFTFTAKTTPTHPQTQSRTYTLVNLETFDERRINGYGAELYPHKPDMYLPFRFSSMFIHVYLFVTLSILQSQFTEKGFKKAETSEQNVVLLLFLFCTRSFHVYVTYVMSNVPMRHVLECPMYVSL